MSKKQTNPIGRPSLYTQELADKICQLISDGASMRTACKSEELPSIQTVFSWFRTHNEFLEQYERATKERSEAHHEELMNLGDDAVELAKSVKGPGANAVVSAVKLKADNLKWSMAHMKPKKYGEKLDVTSDGKAIPAPIYGGSATTDV